MNTTFADLQRQAIRLPQGDPLGADRRTLVVGEVTGLNIPSGQVQVVVEGSDPVWVPAAPSIYESGARVRIRRAVDEGGHLEFCEGPIDAAPMVVTGRVTAVSGVVLTVTVMGVSYDLRTFAAGTYAVGNDVWVLRHPTGFGVPQAVLGIASVQSTGVNPGAGTPNPGALVTREAFIGPQRSGSFKADSGRWDSWNTDRYGGISTLWQGNRYGSGPMVGWAGYGDQVIGLNAETIDAISVTVVRADSSESAGKSPVLQGTASGERPTGAPAGVGAQSAGPGLAPGQSASVTLAAGTHEAWRTGAIKGLITVGSDYAGFFGTSRGGAMVLRVQYKVRA